jgi:hypothetical protein
MEREKDKPNVSGRTNRCVKAWLLFYPSTDHLLREVVVLSKRDQMAQDITFVKARLSHQEHSPLCPPTTVLLAPVVELEDLLATFLYFHLLLLIQSQRLNYL